MSFIKKNWSKLAVAFYAFFILISTAYASESCEPGKICNPIPNVTSLNGLIKTLLEGVLKVGIPVVALAIIYVLMEYPQIN